MMEYEAQKESNIMLENGIVAPSYIEEHMDMLCEVNKKIITFISGGEWLSPLRVTPQSFLHKIGDKQDTFAV